VSDFDLFKTLDGLIDAWCERRALKPLHYLLRAYPAVIAHTDQKFELLDALKDVKGLCREDLTREERRLVAQAHDFMEERLRSRVN
jgi:hypothetical protein